MFIRHRPYSKPSKCFFPPMKALSSRKVKNLSLSSDRIFPIRDRILNLPNAPFHKDAPMRCVTESRQSFSTLLIKRKKQLSAVEKIIKTKIDWPATLRNSKHSAWFISFTKARHQNPPRDRRDAICFISSLKTCQNLTWKHLSRHGDKCFFCWRKENCFFFNRFFFAFSFTKARHQNPPRDRRDAVRGRSLLQSPLRGDEAHQARHAGVPAGERVSAPLLLRGGLQVICFFVFTIFFFGIS